MKVGDLVKWTALRGEDLVGIIVGFDDENDPIVKSCGSSIKCAHWRSSLEVVSESGESGKAA